jgi:hypothetical protein
MISKRMERQCRSSWTGVHEYFCPEEYDAGASLSTFNEVEWRTTQHPLHTFKIGFDPKESVSL